MAPVLLIDRKSQAIIRRIDQRSWGRQGLRALMIGVLFLALAAHVSWSHPLGNFSLNHYNSLEIHPSAIITQHVLDFAEIPSFNELTRVDTNDDNKITPKEICQYKETLHRRFLPGWILLLKQDLEKTEQRSQAGWNGSLNSEVIFKRALR